MSAISDPVDHADPITLSDTVNITFVGSGIEATKGILVGTAGNITALMGDGRTCLLPNLLAGVVYPFRVKRVNSTNTTASNLVALY